MHIRIDLIGSLQLRIPREGTETQKPGSASIHVLPLGTSKNSASWEGTAKEVIAEIHEALNVALHNKLQDILKQRHDTATLENAHTEQIEKVLASLD